MAVGYLADLADSLLDAATDGLTLATTGATVPTHRWVAHAEPADDHCCDGGQLTVHLGALTHEPFGRFGAEGVGQACAITPQATFIVTLKRCVPSMGDGGQAPTPVAQEDAATGLLVDLWAVMTELYDRFYANTLFPEPTQCTDVTIGLVEPAEAQGGCAGWRVPVTVVCNDPGPTGS